MMIVIKNPQRVAWATVLTSFILFCAICVGSVLAIRWFLLDSSVSLHTTVHVSRGTIRLFSPDQVNPSAVSNQFPVQFGETIRTDDLAQGELSLRDPLENDRVLATIQIMPGSEATLTKATRPRFGLGDHPYIIQLTATGNISVTVAANLDRDIRVEISGSGRRVRLDTAGYYLLTIDPERYSVTVRRGSAVLIDSQNQTKLVGVDQTAYLNVNRQLMIEDVRNFDIVPNPLFEESEESDDLLAPPWQCVTFADNNSEPRGIFERKFFQDRYALHFRRNPSEDVGPSYTGCNQTFSSGLDVSAYDSLKIRATMYLNYHNVDGCGSLGSECILMLRMRYYNDLDLANQTQSEWIQGFYVDFNPNSGAKIRCNSCTSDHIHVNSQTWYSYESQDFVLDLPEDQSNLRPEEIVSIEFYSSGHKYEAYISEVSLIGEINGQEVALN